MKFKVIEYIKNVVRGRVMKVNQEKLIQAINEKWMSKNCPLCGKNNWNIGTNMVTMLGVSENTSIRIGGEITPVVAITCNECGNTIYINPLVINCVDR